MKVTVSGRKAWAEGTAVELGALDAALAVPHPDRYIIKQKGGRRADEWDGMVRFLRRWSSGNWFPLGLLDRATAELGKLGGTVAVEGLDGWQPVPERFELRGAVLDEVQAECARALLKVRLGSVELSTGSGKTLVAAALANSWLRSRGRRSKVMVLVPKRNLMYATARELKGFLEWEVGLLGDGHRDLDADVLVATPNTAAGPNVGDAEELQKFLRDNVGLVILDECHHAPSELWSKVLEDSGAEATWAMSGKVSYVSDQLAQVRIEAWLGRPVFTGRNEGRLVPVTVRFYDLRLQPLKGLAAALVDRVPATWTVNGVKRWGWYRGRRSDNSVDDDLCTDDGRGGRVPDKSLFGTYDQSGKSEPDPESAMYATAHDVGIMESAGRNAWAVRTAVGMAREGRKVVVTVRRLRHARKLVEAISRHVPCSLLTGKVTGKSQVKVIDGFGKGGVNVMVAVYSVIMEGVNLPSLTDLVKLDGVSGEQVLEQMKGRVERAADGKERGFLHVPSDHHHPSLRRAAAAMRRYYGTRPVTVESVTV